MVESSETIVNFMLSFSLFLIVISAVHRYARNFIIAGVTILMFLGAILPSVPFVGFEVEELTILLKRFFISYY